MSLVAERRLAEALKKRALAIGGKRFQVAGIIERDLAGELDRDDWTVVVGRVRVVKSSKGMRMLTSNCHENAAQVALQRDWECWTGLALSKDGIWRVHTWARVPSTGTIIETTEPRIVYYGVRLSKSDTVDLL